MTMTDVRDDVRLAFDATVPRSLVHRAAVHEVFLTDSLGVDETHVVCGAHLPRFHGLYDDTVNAAGPDLMLLLEINRQAAILVAHRHLDVPVGFNFVWLTAELQMLPEGIEGAAASTQQHAVLDVEVTQKKVRNGVVGEFTSQITTLVEGVAISVASIRIQCWPPEAYAKLRQGRSAASVDILPPIPAAEPWLVGRRRQNNVTVAPTHQGSATYSVRVDTSHPCFFDHPLDHVPGMLQLEAARQSAICFAAHRLMRSPDHAQAIACTATFSAFAELDKPVTMVNEIETIDLASREVIVKGVLLQGETVCCTTETTLAYIPRTVTA